MSLSILLMQMQMASFSCTACLRSCSVFRHTPSAASMKRTTPSQSLMAAVTSSEKLTCPGVSKTFMMYDFCFRSCRRSVTGLALMLTPLSCSV
uniref:Secreted protein n=1 Tax=Ixodes ricinus TaxID=34613 RepID=A0A6B0UCI3_IXORI